MLKNLSKKILNLYESLVVNRVSIRENQSTIRKRIFGHNKKSNIVAVGRCR